MKLHRLVLTNYRGIAHREVHFPDSGVVVVCGANEIGKTSMIEALDLLLESKDRSTKKEVKQVKPTHADVGAEVLAEISTGAYRFIYRKRFHKKCETELTISAPRREQLTGDEAHERVRAILGETVDTDLWHAQRVLQTGSTAAVDLSDCDALSRALDVAAGGADTLSGNEPALLERIDAECGKYFTGTGRPTGEWAAAIAALAKADEEVARCVTAVGEVDDRVHRHVTLTERLAALSDDLQTATERAVQAKKVAAALALLREQVENARLVATAAKATSAVSAAAHNERLRMQADLSSRIATLEKFSVELIEAKEAEAASRAAAKIAEEAAEQAVRDMAMAQERSEVARRVVNALMARDEERQLVSRLNRIRSAEQDLANVVEKLSRITLTNEVMADIESAAILVQRLEAQLALAATTVEFTAVADMELSVGGQSMKLRAGQTWTPESSAAMSVELPGLLTVQIHPGVNISDAGEKLKAAQILLAEVLAQGSATSVAHAREIDSERRTLTHALNRVQSDLNELIAHDDLSALVESLAELRTTYESASELIEPGLDLANAKRELAGAAENAAHSHRDVVAHQKVVAETKSLALEKASAVTLLSRQCAAVSDELALLRERLAASQSQATDDEVAMRAVTDAEALRQAEERVEELAQQCVAAEAQAVDAELIAANQAAERLEREHAETGRMLNDTAVELAVMGTQGRQGQLDAAQIAHAHATAEHLRVSRRARSAQLLRSVMTRHREDTRQSYVAPFRTEIERLGRTVFGETFEIEIDSDLRICSRTLDGKTVPYESLSGGAKEQLGILARLAGAALVAREDSVPVVIDDALGFSDPDRLIKMGAVFDQVGDDGQVIVLTCTPTRYLGIEDAHIIELTPAS